MKQEFLINRLNMKSKTDSLIEILMYLQQTLQLVILVTYQKL